MILLIFLALFASPIWSSSHCLPVCTCTTYDKTTRTSVDRAKCVCPGIGIIPDEYLNIEYLDLEYSSRVILAEGNLPLFPRLATLNVSGIQYVSDDAFSGIRGITTLIMFRNFFKSIENVMFSPLQNLRILSVMGQSTKVDTIEDGAFANLSRLTNLVLVGNAISDLSIHAFSGLEELTQLDLSDNKLVRIEGLTFSSLVKLTELTLSDNNILYIDGYAFHYLGNLRSLTLSNNNIQVMEEPKFGPEKSNVNVDLQYNALRCDCHFTWITKWITILGEHAEGECQSPSEFQGQTLSNVYKNGLPQCPSNDSIITAQEGRLSELTCPIVDATWTTADGANLSRHGEYQDQYYLTEFDTLIIKQPNPNMNGIFICSASDSTRVYTYHLNVLGNSPDTWSKFVIPVITGLVCLFVGYFAKPAFLWLRNSLLNTRREPQHEHSELISEGVSINSGDQNRRTQDPPRAESPPTVHLDDSIAGQIYHDSNKPSSKSAVYGSLS